MSGNIRDKAMTTKAKKQTVTEEMEVLTVSQGVAEFCVVGESPLVLNKLSEKAKHELIMPRGRKTSAERGASLKHDPIAEFRASAHTIESESANTLLAVPGAAFKRAMANAALDMPQTKKSQIGRLTYVPDEYIEIYGEPKLFMAVVRSADINHTPDVRSRVIIPKWAAYVRVNFATPILRQKTIAALLQAAGIYIGVGDGRPEKGALSFGRFRLVGANDADFARIVEGGGRVIQERAMNAAEPYDAETRELLSWFIDEAASRGHKPTLVEAA